MTPSRVHPQEAQRLALLCELRLLDTAPEAEFDAVTALLQATLGVPIALISLVDAERQWFKSHPGLLVTETDRDASFCSHAVACEQTLRVDDTQLDERFADNPLVVGAPHIRTYVGAPLFVQGLPLGAICAIDSRPRADGDHLQTTLEATARIVEHLLESRLREQRAHAARVEAVQDLEALSDWSWQADARGRITCLDTRFETATGVSAATVLGQPLVAPDDQSKAYLTAISQALPWRQLPLPAFGMPGRLLISGLPTRSATGDHTGWRGSVLDPLRGRQATQRATGAERRLTEALEGFAGAVMLTGPDGDIVLSNVTWRRVFGAACASGERWRDAVQDMVVAHEFVQAEGREEAFVRLLADTDAVMGASLELLHRGQWWSLRREALSGGDCLHVAIDITAHKEAEARWRHHAEVHRAVAELASDGVAVVNMAGDVLMHNASAAGLWGLPASRLAGQSIFKLDQQRVDDGGRVQSLDQHPVRQALSQQIIVRGHRHGMVRPGQPVQWLSIDVLPLSNGREAVMIFRDVTESRAAAAGREPLVGDDESLPEAAARGQGEGAWQWDIARDCIFLSDACKAMLGHLPDDPVDNAGSWLSRLHPDDAVATRISLRQQIEGEGRRLQLLFRMQAGDAKSPWISVRGRISRDAQGRPFEAAGLMHDVTDQREAFEARAQQHAAEAANTAKSQFLSRVSHEVRTPLNAIVGFAQLLRRRPALPADISESVLRIDTAGQHLLELVNDLLDIQRIETDSLPLSLEPVRWLDVIGQTLNLLSADAAAHAVEIEIDEASIANTWVRADMQRLRQVTLNLLGNAIKYSAQGTRVRLHTAPFETHGAAAEARVRLIVTDQGPGLDAAQLTRLFQPFERLGQERGQVQGTGLGLVISQRLVQAMGGDLHVESTVGQGSSFIIELLAESAVEAADRVGPAQTRFEALTLDSVEPGCPSGHRYCAFYVEDNPVNVVLMEAVMAHAPNWELQSADCGADAHTRLTQPAGLQPDLLLLDAHLPDCHGIDLLAEIRARHPHLAAVPAVMLTADAMPEDRQASLEAGFVAHWTKPIDIDRVIHTLLAWSAADELVAT